MAVQPTGPPMWSQGANAQSWQASRTHGVQSRETPSFKRHERAWAPPGELVLALGRSSQHFGECLSCTTQLQQQAAECIAEGGATNGVPLAGPGPAGREGPPDGGSLRGAWRAACSMRSDCARVCCISSCGLSLVRLPQCSSVQTRRRVSVLKSPVRRRTTPGVK